ncbi:MAG: arsenate reductase [Spirochaetes bacterium RBG_13_51_14]|nr:MAG: arsenate reductase [Spirochaetes bacterium RBG_13_51_14]
MAEGMARHLKGGEIEAYSAGTEPRGLDPRAVAVMKEIGVDISAQRSKHVDEFAGIEFDYVITLCGGVQEICPMFPGKTKTVHRGFDDPPELARNAAGEELALAHYRRVRDEIRDYVGSLPGSLRQNGVSFNLT